MNDVYKIGLYATSTSLLFLGIGYLTRQSLQTAQFESSIETLERILNGSAMGFGISIGMGIAAAAYISIEEIFKDKE